MCSKGWVVCVYTVLTGVPVASSFFLPSPSHLPSLFIHKPFLFSAFPFLGEKLLFLACWWSFVPSCVYQHGRIGAWWFFVGQNWHFILPFQCCQPGESNGTVEMNLCWLHPAPRQNPSQNCVAKCAKTSRPGFGLNFEQSCSQLIEAHRLAFENVGYWQGEKCGWNEFQSCWRYLWDQLWQFLTGRWEHERVLKTGLVSGT